jgi:DNA-binding NarL/FixJ family response regulator
LLIEAAERLEPEVIVADVSLPDVSGIEATRRIKRQNPDARIVCLTMHPEVSYATSALEAGALGFVLKHSAASELIKAIRMALEGQLFVSPAIANEVLQRLISRPAASRQRVANLTPRQVEVLRLVAEGQSACQVAQVLSISPRTVESHKYQIMNELDLHSNAELVQYAIRHGIIAV